MRISRYIIIFCSLFLAEQTLSEGRTIHIHYSPENKEQRWNEFLDLYIEVRNEIQILETKISNELNKVSGENFDVKKIDHNQTIYREAVITNKPAIDKTGKKISRMNGHYAVCVDEKLKEYTWDEATCKDARKKLTEVHKRYTELTRDVMIFDLEIGKLKNFRTSLDGSDPKTRGLPEDSSSTGTLTRGISAEPQKSTEESSVSSPTKIETAESITPSTESKSAVSTTSSEDQPTGGKTQPQKTDTPEENEEQAASSGGGGMGAAAMMGMGGMGAMGGQNNNKGSQPPQQQPFSSGAGGAGASTAGAPPKEETPPEEKKEVCTVHQTFTWVPNFSLEENGVKKLAVFFAPRWENKIFDLKIKQKNGQEESASYISLKKSNGSLCETSYQFSQRGGNYIMPELIFSRQKADGSFENCKINIPNPGSQISGINPVCGNSAF